MSYDVVDLGNVEAPTTFQFGKVPGYFIPDEQSDFAWALNLISPSEEQFSEIRTWLTENYPIKTGARPSWSLRLRAVHGLYVNYDLDDKHIYGTHEHVYRTPTDFMFSANIGMSDDIAVHFKLRFING